MARGEKMDVRYPAERAKFARRVYNKRAINGLDDLDGDGSTTINDAALLFDSDDADSDGDGVNNLLERAFGSDSLTYDRKASMPRIIKKKDGKQRITFLKYQNAYAAEEGLQYVVERSKDLRKWTTAGMTQIDLNGAAPGKGKAPEEEWSVFFGSVTRKLKIREENRPAAFEFAPSKFLP